MPGRAPRQKSVHRSPLDVLHGFVSVLGKIEELKCLEKECGKVLVRKGRKVCGNDPSLTTLVLRVSQRKKLIPWDAKKVLTLRRANPESTLCRNVLSRAKIQTLLPRKVWKMFRLRKANRGLRAQNFPDLPQPEGFYRCAGPPTPAEGCFRSRTNTK